jgi:glycolate oxidase iron-sulfur subunit
MSPLLQDRRLKPLAATPWHRQVGEINTAAGVSGLKVAFFVGCLIDKLYPPVAAAVRTALEHHGVGLWVPPEQGCCGIPALAGVTPPFNTLRHNLARLAGDFDYQSRPVPLLSTLKSSGQDDQDFRKSRPVAASGPTL